MRPNVHIEDVTDLYVQSLDWPDEAVDGEVFNAGYDNHSVNEIADITRGVVGEDVVISSTPTDDLRSYHISSEKIKRVLGFVPSHSIQDAVGDLVGAYGAGRIPNPMNDARYYNIKLMQEVKLR